MKLYPASNILLLSACLLIACTAPSNGGLTKDSSLLHDSQAKVEEHSSNASVTSTNIHPISLPAFMQKEFNGRDLILGRILAQNDSYTRYAITYKSGELTISGIMNIPKGIGPFPLLILNHGYIDPAVYTQGRGLKREQDYFARNGYAVLHTDYRNHALSDSDENTETTFRLGYAEDSINAILAAQKADLPSVDVERVGMLGHSMGGGVTLNVLVTKPDLVDAAVLYAPVSADAVKNFERWTTRRPERAQQMREKYGDPETQPEFWQNVSASTFYDRIETPMMIHHGTADDSVPVVWSEELESDLIALEKDVTLHLYDNAPHEFIRNWNTFMEQNVAFFDTHLKSHPVDNNVEWQPPISQEKQRVTKKPFGIFITPENSPVSPERFRGWHSGVDYETLPSEEDQDVTVLAACSGEVLSKRWVSGYGGVLVQRCTSPEGEAVTTLYGHLNIDSIDTNVGDRLTVGMPIGVLGAGYSDETDNERKHLHFAIHKGSQVELRGYAQQQSELDAWIDPTQMF